MRYANPSRQGAVLLMVSAIAGMLLIMTMSFLAMMRADERDSHAIIKEAQARMLLTAGLMYIQESSRLGYDDPNTSTVELAYGWNDVRPPEHFPSAPADWRAGPRDVDGNALYAYAPLVNDTTGDGVANAPAWPAPGSVARCPLDVPVMPPRAIQQRPFYNTISPQKLLAGEARVITTRDPQPALNNASNFAAGLQGTTMEGTDLAWFRIYREDPRDHNGVDDPNYDDPPWDGAARLPDDHTTDIDADDTDDDDDGIPDSTDDTRNGVPYIPGLDENYGIFILTLGVGGSRGHRTVQDALSSGDFFSPAPFLTARGEERLLWYRVEWDGGVPGMIRGPGKGSTSSAQEGFMAPWADYSNMTHGRDTGGWGGFFASGGYPGGTIRWIQRLDREPTRW